jgi:septal ring-binding cell division protein DamX
VEKTSDGYIMSWIKQDPIKPDDPARGIRREQSRTDPYRSGSGPEVSGPRDSKTNANPGTPFSTGTPRFMDDFQEHPKTKAGRPLNEKSGEIVIKRRKLLLGSAGIVFLMIWVFFLGVMVGRGTIYNSPGFRDLKNRFSDRALRDNLPAVDVQTRTAAGSTTPSPKPETELSFYNDLAQTEPQPERGLDGKTLKVVTPPFPEITADTVSVVAEDNRPSPPPTVKAMATASAGSTGEEEPLIGSEGNAPQKAAPTQNATGAAPENQSLTVTSGVKTVDKNQSEALPPKRKSGENYTVQVAIARSVEKAEEEAQRLRKQGFDVYYYQVEHDNRKYFRIRIGRYATRDEAVAMMEKLEAAGRSNMFVSALTD